MGMCEQREEECTNLIEEVEAGEKCLLELTVGWRGDVSSVGNAAAGGE